MVVSWRVSAVISCPISRYTINMLALQGAVGSYTGHLIGTVFNNGNQYVAAGG